MLASHEFGTSVHSSTGATPLFLRIQHGGRTSCGGQSPIKGSSIEGQAWLNLNAWLPCVMDNYIKRMMQAFDKKVHPHEF